MPPNGPLPNCLTSLRSKQRTTGLTLGRQPAAEGQRNRNSCVLPESVWLRGHTRRTSSPEPEPVCLLPQCSPRDLYERLQNSIPLQPDSYRTPSSESHLHDQETQ